MKETLLVDGRELPLEEVKAIVREHFSKKEVTEQQETTIQRPVEGVPFPVNPQGINRNFFKQKRQDRRQEETRKLILEAFAQLDKNLKKYGKSFKTLIPRKTWEGKTVGELRDLSTNLGDHMADWVEQALEWAQRIVNGETWEVVCNDVDTASWFRLINWKNGYAKVIGGSRGGGNYRPPSDIDDDYFFSNSMIYHTVPLIVLYK